MMHVDEVRQAHLWAVPSIPEGVRLIDRRPGDITVQQKCILFSPSKRSKPVPIVMAVLVLITLARAGGPPWKDKPYQQWTYEDINSIFADSPWSHTLTVARAWVPWVNKELPEEALGAGGRGMPGSLEQSTDQARGSQVRFYISWMSSQVMRKALARFAVLHGKNPAEADETINQEPTEYSIMIQGSDMTPFQQKKQEYYQSNAFLETKKTRHKVFPQHVSYELKSDGKSVVAVKFFFPKQTSSGEPLIAPHEKHVEFACRLAESLLQAEFNVQEMELPTSDLVASKASKAEKQAEEKRHLNEGVYQSQSPNEAIGQFKVGTGADANALKEENEFITSAERDIQAGRYQEAGELLQKSIAADPNKWDLYRALAACQLKLKQYQNAILSLDKGIELANLASKAEPDKATRLRAAIEQMLSSEGVAYVKLGNRTEGVARLQKAAEMDSNPGLAYFNLCATLYNSREWKGAADACSKSINADPSRAEAYFMKGSALSADAPREDRAHRVTPETKEALSKYLELTPNGTHAAEARALLLELGQPGAKAPK